MAIHSNKLTIAITLIVLAFAASGCKPAGTNTTTNEVATNSTVENSNTGTANVSTPVATAAAIETREPDQYAATVTLKIEVTGAQTISTPPLSATFARSGANRRITIKIPNGDELVYLDRADKRYIILPGRKQYAEIDRQSAGFDVPQIMTPAQLVSQVKNVSGCEKAGEETFAGRNAIKYRCAAAANTGTKAGEVKTESFIYVDKETSLPLRSESTVSSSANVGGASAVKIVSELSNIQTNVPSTIFDEPTGMNKIDPGQVKAQVEAIGKAAAIFMQGMLRQ